MDSKDLIVVGGGPGGLVAALRASEFGLNVLLVEKNELGGACLNRGCIPSKSLKRASEIVNDARNNSELGINAKINLDYSQTIGWTRKNFRKLRKATRNRLKRAGIDIEKGKGRFSSAQEIIVGGKKFGFDKCIICTGSKPKKLPTLEFDHEKIINSADFFDLDKLPNEIIVGGGGYVGMELGTICQRLGSKVTILEAEDQILPNFDKDLVRPVERKSKRKGPKIELDKKISGIKRERNKITVITDSGKEFKGDKFLLALGRSPITDGLGLENTDVKVDKNGFIKVNDSFQTSQSNIYAIGDVIGGKMLAHEAYNEASVAIDIIAGMRRKKSIIPEVIFTDPEIARVGSFEEEYKSGKAFFKEAPAAHTKNKIEGFVRINIEDNIVKGGEIVGYNASEIIHQIGFAVQNRMEVEKLLSTVRAHPTMSECISLAAEKASDSKTSVL